jgi:hypothetical protein
VPKTSHSAEETPSGALLVVSAIIWKERPVGHLRTNVLKWAQWKRKAHDGQLEASLGPLNAWLGDLHGRTKKTHL